MIPQELIWAIIIIVGVIALYIFYRKNFKFLILPAVALITGAPKVGKSLLCVKLSQKDYKKRHFKWWFVTKILRKKNIEEPLFYTNVTISFCNIKGKKSHRLDKNIRVIQHEHLLRDIRFNYGSVIYLQEASLLADNQDVNNQVRNVDYSLFNKLIAHETKGGALYYDTQNILDCHYSIKRVCSNFYFIQKKINIFIGMILYVREMVNTDIGNNNFEDDIDTTTRKVFVPRWYFKHYDRYEFSYLTDSLNNSSKCFDDGEKKLISFNTLYTERADKRTKEVL